MDAQRVVLDFCEAVKKRDAAALAAFFAPDAVYHNIPLEPVQGREAIEATLKQFIDPNGEAEFDVRAIATAGNKVLTERVDRFTMQGRRVEVPVMGAFEVDAQGKITAWRDYFDMAQFMKQLG